MEVGDTITVNVGMRRYPPERGEKPTTCAACGQMKVAGGAARVIAEAQVYMFPLCQSCAADENVDGTILRKYGFISEDCVAIRSGPMTEQ
jgi:hypothetical protein